jgi:hypothetical protein
MAFASDDIRAVEIRVPWEWAPNGVWRVTAAYLKLRLKYGIIGRLKHQPWGYINRSTAFDAHALLRGPQSGLPDHSDFLLTLAMNSRINGDDVARFDQWWRDGATQQQLGEIRDALMGCADLAAASPEILQPVAAFADQLIEDQERLKGLKIAKIFKWLSAWAPAHIPMLDNVVAYDILAYVEKPYAGHKSLDLLLRFQSLVRSHSVGLRRLGEQISADLGAAIASPLPAVRTLDSLLWFDWELWRKEYFHEWVQPRDGSFGFHFVTEKGEAS